MVNFCKRASGAYVHRATENEYICPGAQNKFCIYDGFENNKHYIINSIDDPSSIYYCSYYNNDGVIISYGVKKETIFKVTQEQTGTLVFE